MDCLRTQAQLPELLQKCNVMEKMFEASVWQFAGCKEMALKTRLLLYSVHVSHFSSCTSPNMNKIYYSCIHTGIGSELFLGKMFGKEVLEGVWEFSYH